MMLTQTDRLETSAEMLRRLVTAADRGLGLLDPLLDSLSEGVFIVDAERNLLAFNRAAEAITGFARQDVLGRHCLTGIRCTRCLESCGIFARGQVRGVPLELFRADGSAATIIKSARVLHDSDGHVIGAVEVFSEKRDNDATGHTDATWESLDAMMLALGRAFAILDQTGRVRRVSPGLADIFGSAAEALVGREAADLFGPELFGEQSLFRAALLAGERREGWRATVIARDGTSHTLSVTAAPLGEALPCDGKPGSTGRILVVVRPESQADARAGEAIRFEGMVARSLSMRRIFQLVEHLRDSDAAVLLTGESGTGKELVARAIHARSVRANKPFVAINCGALPSELLESELFGHARGAFTGAVRDKPGRFEVAGEGTIFLDEIGDLPLPLQVKLLRVLQERNFERVGETESRVFDARVVAATHHDLARRVREGKFREDLFYRLNVVPILLPPLRQRREDIELLVNHIVESIGRRRNRALRLSPGARRALLSHDWPGNVRQIENALEYATAVCEGQTIHVDDLPLEVAGADGPARQTPAGAEPAADVAARYPTAQDIRAAMQASRHRRGEAASRLGVSRTTLWRRMKELGLS